MHISSFALDLPRRLRLAGARQRRVLGCQFRFLQMFGDLVRKWLCELPNRFGIRVSPKSLANCVGVFENFLSILIGQPVANFCRLSSASQADEHSRGLIACVPLTDFAVKVVDPYRWFRVLSDDVEIRSILDLELRDRLD